MATVDFRRKIVLGSDARRDADHLPLVAFSVPQIPDRTEALVADGDDPYPAMLAVLRRIERAGATFVAMLCNTAHHWFDRLSARTDLPILHIVDAIADDLRDDPRAAPLGVIGTTGTVASGVYSRGLARHGLACLTPDDQDLVMNAILQAKAGGFAPAAEIFARQIDLLKARGCGKVVLACTEVPVALSEAGLSAPDCIDAPEALAHACIRYAKRERSMRNMVERPA